MLRKEVCKPSYASLATNQISKYSCFRQEQLQMLHVGQNSCKCFTWAKTAANATCGPEQLQTVQLQKQDRRQSIASREAAANASHGPDQLQMLHTGQTSCKCFSYKSKIGGRALHHQEKGYLHQATNSQSEQLAALGDNSCKFFSTVLAHAV